jgi:hypothetical protein
MEVYLPSSYTYSPLIFNLPYIQIKTCFDTFDLETESLNRKVLSEIYQCSPKILSVIHFRN